MAGSAANADGGITLTAVVARRKKDNKLVLLQTGAGQRAGVIEEVVLDENSDHALDLYAVLKKTSGQNGKYTAAALFLRAKTRSRKVSFA